MATLNVSLPDSMKDWVDAQAKSSSYSNPSEYVRDLIRKDQERTVKVAHMQLLVTEALDGGISEQSMHDIERAGIREVEADTGGRGL